MDSTGTADSLMLLETTRSTVYRKLAHAFRPPDPSLPKVLRDLEKSATSIGSTIASGVIRLRESAPPHGDALNLQVDHTRLFAGPFLVAAPPFGSVYLEDQRRLMGDSTMDARKHYQSLGLDLAEDFREPPDHISAELEFMHVLISRTLNAIETRDPDLFTESILHRSMFLRTHLGSWIPTFAARVMEHAGTAFYKHLASVTQKFVDEEINTLPDLSTPQGQQDNRLPR